MISYDIIHRRWVGFIFSEIVLESLKEEIFTELFPVYRIAVWWR